MSPSLDRRRSSPVRPGLDRAYALELARRGANVVVNDVGVDAETESPWAEAVVAEIETAGGRAVAAVESVMTPEGGQALTELALERFGAVDIVVTTPDSCGRAPLAT